MTKRYLSRAEAAEYCGLGLSTLNNLAGAGKGPRYIKAFGRVLYDRADLDEWLQSMKVDPSTRKMTDLTRTASPSLIAKGRNISRTQLQRKPR